MQELAKTVILSMLDKLNSTELLILSTIVVVLGAFFGTIIFAISRGVTDICGKKFFKYKDNN